MFSTLLYEDSKDNGPKSNENDGEKDARKEVILPSWHSQPTPLFLSIRFLTKSLLSNSHIICVLYLMEWLIVKSNHPYEIGVSWIKNYDNWPLKLNFFKTLENN